MGQSPPFMVNGSSRPFRPLLSLGRTKLCCFQPPYPSLPLPPQCPAWRRLMCCLSQPLSVSDVHPTLLYQVTWSMACLRATTTSTVTLKMPWLPTFSQMVFMFDLSVIGKSNCQFFDSIVEFLFLFELEFSSLFGYLSYSICPHSLLSVYFPNFLISSTKLIN